MHLPSEMIKVHRCKPKDFKCLSVVFDFAWQCIKCNHAISNMGAVTFLTILNIIYMFDDCRTLHMFTGFRALIKLHAFFVHRICFASPLSRWKTTKSASVFLSRITFCISFHLNFAIACWNREWPFFIRSKVFCTQITIPLNGKHLQNALVVSANDWSKSNKRISFKRNGKINIYYNYNAIIFCTIFAHFSNYFFLFVLPFNGWQPS